MALAALSYPSVLVSDRGQGARNISTVSLYNTMHGAVGWVHRAAEGMTNLPVPGLARPVTATADGIGQSVSTIFQNFSICVTPNP